MAILTYMMQIHNLHCAEFNYRGTVIHPPQYYHTIINLMSEGKKEAAFIMMSMIDVVDVNDNMYWNGIPGMVLKEFPNDVQKLHFYGMKIAQKRFNHRDELSLLFAKRLIEIGQINKAREIITVAARCQFKIKIMIDPDKDYNENAMANQFALVVYQIALRFDSEGVYSVFMALFEHIHQADRYHSLYACYQHAFLRVRNKRMISNIVDNHQITS